MRKPVAILAALLLAFSASASAVSRSISVTLVANYNLAATNYTYSVYRANTGADPLGDGITAGAKVTNGAGATDVTAVTANTDPFAGLAAGDLLIFPNAPTVINTGASAVNTYGAPRRQERVIVTATDDDNVVVDRDIILDQNAAGYTVAWKKFETGETVDDGWFKTGDFAGVEFHIQVTNLNATGIDYSIECRHLQSNSAPAQVDAGSIQSEALGSNSHTFYLGIPFDQCRVGLKVDTDGGDQAVWVEVVGEKYGDR